MTTNITLLIPAIHSIYSRKEGKCMGLHGQVVRTLALLFKTFRLSSIYILSRSVIVYLNKKLYTHVIVVCAWLNASWSIYVHLGKQMSVVELGPLWNFRFHDTPDEYPMGLVFIDLAESIWCPLLGRNNHSLLINQCSVADQLKGLVYFNKKILTRKQP